MIGVAATIAAPTIVKTLLVDYLVVPPRDQIEPGFQRTHFAIAYKQ
jgi:hypothetical protein